MGSPLVLAIALLLELIDFPKRWRGHLVSRLIPPQMHPVALIYRGAARIARKGSLARNIAALLAFTAGPALAAYYAERALGHGAIAAVVEAYLLKLAFSETQILYPCRSAFKRGSAKPVVQEFVRRDLSNASPGHVASACLETAAESLADSFISPLFWYALLGLPGAWLQRAANTLDGLMGFKDWGKSGAPAAYLDTALNYIPARLAALFIYAASAVLGMRPRPRKPGEMESINARWPISALAYSLGVKLEKPGSYSIGFGELPTASDVLRGLEVLAAAATLYSAALMLILYMGLS